MSSDTQAATPTQNEPKNSTDGEDFITIAELCEKLKVSRSLVYTLINDKENPLPKHKLGRALRFRYSEITEHLKKVEDLKG